MTRRRTRVPALVPLGIATVLVLAGCGSSEGGSELGSEPTTPSTTEASTTTTVDREQAVLDAYLASWAAKTESNDPPDPDAPALAETHTGPALAQAVDNRRAYQITGRVGRYPEGSISEHRAEVMSVLGEEATVRDCSIDDGQVIVDATGEVVNDLVVTALFEGTMVLENDRWKLSSLTLVEQWEGVAGCAT